MSLFATLSFDDEDPDVHAHFTSYAQALDDTNPREMARVLRVFEEALHAYEIRVPRSRLALEARMSKPAEEAPRGQ